jgi:hypothetical protein
VEVKRAETLRLPDWTRQAELEAPSGTIPIVAYRRNREPWRVSVRLDHLIALLPRSEHAFAPLARNVHTAPDTGPNTGGAHMSETVTEPTTPTDPDPDTEPEPTEPDPPDEGGEEPDTEEADE